MHGRSIFSMRAITCILAIRPIGGPVTGCPNIHPVVGDMSSRQQQKRMASRHYWYLQYSSHARPSRRDIPQRGRVKPLTYPDCTSLTPDPTSPHLTCSTSTGLHSVPSPLRLVYTEIVLKALKLSLAVVNTMPGICGWKWSSFTSFCPWCTNSNWGGTSTIPPSELGAWRTIGASSSSRSTDRSQRVAWSSDPEAAKTEGSDGCHSTDVMGAVCQVKWATGAGLLLHQYTCVWHGSRRTNSARGVDQGLDGIRKRIAHTPCQTFSNPTLSTLHHHHH